MVKKLKDSLLVTISFVLTIGFVWIIFAAYTSLTTVTSWSNLTATGWNNLIDYANKSVKQDSSIITVDNTNQRIGINNSTPTTTLDINWSVSMWLLSSINAFGTWYNCPTTNVSYPYDTYVTCYAWWWLWRSTDNANWCLMTIYTNDVLSWYVWSKRDSANLCLYVNYSVYLPANTNIRFVNWPWWPTSWTAYDKTSWNVVKMWK